MSTQQPVVVVAHNPSIEGNIGSCSVVSTDYSVTAFKETTIAVNSCDGSVIDSNTHVHEELVLVPLFLLFIGAFVLLTIKLIERSARSGHYNDY